ncbi:DUF6268 family outer membrane beta-barrel protein [Larkinella sp. VNQ87]|uniref:DUF6268 family outer membrane beta-barrel protein n=1 Tax=Larkinella sp. VNQ87 TaxID=3400921 RepID=UPI003C0F6641
MKTRFGWLIANLVVTLAQAQDRSLVSLAVNHSPVDHALTHSLTKYTFNLNAPIRRSEHRTWLAGLRTEWLRAGGLPGGAESLFGLSAQLIHLHSFNERVQGQFLAGSGLYSDLAGRVGAAWRFTTAFRVRVQRSDRLSYAGGLGYIGQFYGHMLIPTLEIDQKITEKWQWRAILPARLQATYKPRRRHEFSASVGGNNDSYRLSEERLRRYVQIRQVEAGVGWEYRLLAYLSLQVRSGYFVRRRLEIYEADQKGVVSFGPFIDLGDNKRTATFSIADPAPFFQVTVAVK